MKHRIFLSAGHPYANLHLLSKCDVLLSVSTSFASWVYFITPLFALDKNVRKTQKQNLNLGD
jgi:hypothetical protein